MTANMKIYMTIMIVIVIVFGVLFWAEKKDRSERIYRATLNECELADYRIRQSFTVFQERNALINKQNLILQGKC